VTYLIAYRKRPTSRDRVDTYIKETYLIAYIKETYLIATHLKDTYLEKN
jgi:hypothetical protein